MPTNHDELIEWLNRIATTLSISRRERIIATFPPAILREGVQHLIDNFFNRLITITGNDVGMHIELIYHFGRDDTIISIKTMVLKKTSKHPTISDLLPTATLYEQEVHELFGICFQGHPDLAPLLLPDDWPPQVYPMRNEWSLSALAKKLKESS
jgi:NADH:ubiquinone oxidoreductase subunit C